MNTNKRFDIQRENRAAKLSTIRDDRLKLANAYRRKDQFPSELFVEGKGSRPQNHLPSEICIEANAYQPKEQSSPDIFEKESALKSYTDGPFISTHLQDPSNSYISNRPNIEVGEASVVEATPSNTVIRLAVYFNE